MNDLLVALAGQPNSGKSTVFNMLTGARQHVANYPGVTVEKKLGSFKTSEHKIQLVDLPGTYSLTSYTQEERIARDFILREKPDVVVAVVDASNPDRSLYLVFQLQEMEIPMVLCLNMMDTAKSRGMEFDVEALEKELGVPIVPTVAAKNRGKAELMQAIDRAAHPRPGVSRLPRYDPALEAMIESLETRLKNFDHLAEVLPPRWLAVKLMENDEEARRKLLAHEPVSESANVGELVDYVDVLRKDYFQDGGKSPEKAIAAARYLQAGEIVRKVVGGDGLSRKTFTDRIDSVVLHPVLAPIVLAAVLLVFYQLTMVYGTMLADWCFPFLHKGKEFIAGLFPASPDLIRSGLLQSLTVNGLVGGVVAILYYVPIFLVLFALIAILEDSGYMPRVAFIMDRVLRSFGLHGQSTLPLILGGVLVGGCAVPGVMATRAMKDEKARLVTILIMPLMNCLAKIPFYVLIVGLFFAANKGLVLFGISLFSFATALVMAKLFSRYLVKGDPAPFVMELPTYHLPTVGGIIRRSIERCWLFVKKIVTIVAAVMVGVWFFVTFPGIGLEREMYYDAQLAGAQGLLEAGVAPSNPYRGYLSGAKLVDLVHFQERLKAAQQGAIGNEAALKAVNGKFASDNSGLFVLANKGVTTSGAVDGDARKASAALKRFDASIRSIARDRRKEIIDGSWAGQVGRACEPISLLAGFNWRINIAIISSFAAKESLVGTLGTIYSVQEGAQSGSLAQSIRETETGWTIWHALAVLVFVALFPPCLATLIMIKHETQSTGWMVFATVYPIIIGFLLACLVYQLGPRIA
ncbi:MAG: ferrous iron transport protein B [Pseudomonadota bacterium]